ncbi:UNVERIFIED_CONTAM: hypothetical protein PYX00_011499 [Menopon gallinae]|uniref:Deoxyribonuclease TATDN1 n=1 Tax=Menopon gallinae TaxID=328185 RepID=A0AAW2H7L2_9NEOP
MLGAKRSRRHVPGGGGHAQRGRLHGADPVCMLPLAEPIMIADIAFNITDSAFEKDRERVVERCRAAGVFPILVGLDTRSSKQCIEYAEMYGTLCYAGIHPTSRDCDVLSLPGLLESDRVIALGECGLDFDRLHFRAKAEQLSIFRRQLDLGAGTYFLHSRGCHRDFMDVISDYSFGGVVHSFTGELEEAMDYIRRGLYIGINGCSLKTQAHVDSVRDVPLESIVVETDSPYCKIRRSSPVYGHVKTREQEKNMMRRNEPLGVWQVVEALSAIKCLSVDAVCSAVNANCERLFGDRVDKVRLHSMALAMKKNYKPLDRRHSKALLFNYEKMDIDEYWRAANHELDEADTSLGLSGEAAEPRLRQYKKSFDKEYAKELNTVDITGLSDSDMADIADENVPDSVVAEPGHDLELGRGSLEGVRPMEMLESALGSSVVQGSEDAGVDYEYDSASGQSRGSIHSSVPARSRTEDLEKLSASSCVQEPCADTSSRDSSDSISVTKNTIKTTGVFENNNTTREAGMKTLRQLRTKFKAGRPRKEAPKERPVKAEPGRGASQDEKTPMQKAAKRKATMPGNDSSFVAEAQRQEKATKKSRKSRPGKLTLKGTQDVIGVDDARCFTLEKSDYKKVLSFENLESGVLLLRKGAQVQREKAEQNVVVCLLKGKAKVEVRDTGFVLGTGALFVIRKGWTYSVAATSINGAILSFVFSE